MLCNIEIWLVFCDDGYDEIVEEIDLSMCDWMWLMKIEMWYEGCIEENVIDFLVLIVWIF